MNPQALAALEHAFARIVADRPELAADQLGIQADDLAGVSWIADTRPQAPAREIADRSAAA